MPIILNLIFLILNNYDNFRGDIVCSEQEFEARAKMCFKTAY